MQYTAAKTTIKETNIDDNHVGVIGINVEKGWIKSSDDIAKTTVKETTMLEGTSFEGDTSVSC